MNFFQGHSIFSRKKLQPSIFSYFWSCNYGKKIAAKFEPINNKSRLLLISKWFFHCLPSIGKLFFQYFHFSRKLFCSFWNFPNFFRPVQTISYPGGKHRYKHCDAEKKLAQKKSQCFFGEKNMSEKIIKQSLSSC